MVKDRETWSAAVQSGCKESDTTEPLNNNYKNCIVFFSLHPRSTWCWFSLLLVMDVSFSHLVKVVLPKFLCC